MRHRYVHQLIGTLRLQLHARATRAAVDTSITVETLETLTWVTHTDAGDAGVKAVTAMSGDRVLVPFLTTEYPAKVSEFRCCC